MSFILVLLPSMPYKMLRNNRLRLRRAHVLERERLAVVIDQNVLAVANVAAKQPFREFVFQLALNRSLERTRAVNRLVPDPHNMSASCVRKLEGDLTIGQPLPQIAELYIHDLLQVFLSQRMEHDNLVDPIQKFRPENFTKLVRGHVGSHNHDRIFKIDRTTLPIRK